MSMCQLLTGHMYFGSIVVKNVSKQNECTIKSFEYTTCYITSVTSLEFCIKSYKNSPHTPKHRK